MAMELGLLSVVVLLLGLWGLCGADFTSSFTNVTEGEPLLLTWTNPDVADGPLYVEATMYDQAGDSNVNVFQANLTVGLSGSSYNWTDVPYPLRYDSSAQYQLVVCPQNWDVTTQGPLPMLAQSGLFEINTTSIASSGSGSGSGSSTGNQPGLNTSTSSAKPKMSATNRAIIIGVCIGIGIPILIGLGVYIWCLQRMRKETMRQKSRKKRLEMSIN